MSIALAARTHCPPARGLRRERLDIVLSRVRRFPLTTVVAPAGSGKTTALAQFAKDAGVPVAWYSLDSLHGSAETFVAYFHEAIDVALDAHHEPDPKLTTRTAADIAVSIGRVGPMVIVLDDFHLVSGEPAEVVIAELVPRLPSGVSIVISSRTQPRFDLTQLAVSDDLLRVDADDLRFRNWEAEQLLDETYGIVLPPDDVARLTRKVGGWAAGFQLFRLAARDMSQVEQCRLARRASTRSSLAQRYLTQHLLGALDEELRDFLIQTSLLGVVTGEIADDLLARTGSAALLDQLEASDVFVSRLDDQTFRYHEVLRSHLEAVLAEQIDGDILAARYARAAELLEGAGYLGEAIRCLATSSDAAAVEALAARARSHIALDDAGLLDDLPPSTPFSGGDPWLALVRARSDVVGGRFLHAVSHYRLAEEWFGAGSPMSMVCRRERAGVASITDPLQPPSTGWLGALRRGMRDDPLGAAEELCRLDSAAAQLASGVLFLICGDTTRAADRFDAAVLFEESPDWAIDAGRLGHQLTRLVGGSPDESSALAVIDRLLGGLDESWIGRLATMLLAAASPATHGEAAARIARRCRDDGDVWGEMVGRLCAGLAAHDAGQATEHFEIALRLAEQQRSVVMASAAHAGLARSPLVDAEAHRLQSTNSARRCGLAGPPFAAFTREPTVSGSKPAVLRDVRPRPDTTVTDGTGGRPDLSFDVTTRCFGEFRVAPRHEALNDLRPRATALLMRLAADCGQVVHCDVLLADLWPDRDEDMSYRSLQVSVSAIRRALIDDDADRTIDRAEGGYALTPAPTGVCDLTEFHAVANAPPGDPPAALVSAAARALDLTSGGLLPTAGSLEWVVEARRHVARSAVRIARRGVVAALDCNDELTALALTERGLDFDRFDDELWRLAIDAHDRRGDLIGSERCRRQYARTLEELDVDDNVALT